MERLTRNFMGCNQIAACGSDLCGETCEALNDCSICPIKEAIDKLAAYENAEEKNMLTYFPYGMDQKYVYHLIDGSGGRMERLNAHRISICRSISGKPFYQIDGLDIDPEDFGKTVFLTKEEAWNALERFWESKEQEE